jgi:hypothetical protein
VPLDHVFEVPERAWSVDGVQQITLLSCPTPLNGRSPARSPTREHQTCWESAGTARWTKFAWRLPTPLSANPEDQARNHR